MKGVNILKISTLYGECILRVGLCSSYGIDCSLLEGVILLELPGNESCSVMDFVSTLEDVHA